MSAAEPEEAESLLAKYGRHLAVPLPGMTARDLEARLRLIDAIDQHFATTTLEFLWGMHRRAVLDDRTRELVLIGQFAATRSHEHLELALRAAFARGLAPREALESILLCQVYAGDTAVIPAVRIFTRVAAEMGVLYALRDDQLPLDGNNRSRDLEAERAEWDPESAADPRREALMERHGWLGVSSGIHYRGTHHLGLLQHRDELDPEWAHLWLTFTYERMYSRWILDDATRLLCTVGDTLAVGDMTQARAHMAETVKAGIAPRRIMEVVLLVGPYFGSPRMAAGLTLFEAVLAEAGATLD